MSRFFLICSYDRFKANKILEVQNRHMYLTLYVKYYVYCKNYINKCFNIYIYIYDSIYKLSLFYCGTFVFLPLCVHGKHYPTDLWKISYLRILQVIDDLLCAAGRGFFGYWKRSMCQDNQGILRYKCTGQLKSTEMVCMSLFHISLWSYWAERRAQEQPRLW